MTENTQIVGTPGTGWTTALWMFCQVWNQAYHWTYTYQCTNFTIRIHSKWTFFRICLLL